MANGLDVLLMKTPTKNCSLYPKDCDTGYSRGTCTPMFIEALFTIGKYGNSQDVPALTNGLRKCGIYTQWNFMQP
jgi:hypothetical protein